MAPVVCLYNSWLVGCIIITTITFSSIVTIVVVVVGLGVGVAAVWLISLAKPQ